MSNRLPLDKNPSLGLSTPMVVLSWVFSFLFAVTGITFISDDIIIGVCYLAAAIVLVPPLKKIFKGKSKIILLVLLFGIIGIRVLWSIGFLFFPKSPH